MEPIQFLACAASIGLMMVGEKYNIQAFIGIGLALAIIFGTGEMNG